jgi:hypothetical protein
MESSNLALPTTVGKLASKISKIEEETLSLKKQLNDNREQDALHHHPSDTLQVEIIDLKNK